MAQIEPYATDYANGLLEQLGAPQRLQSRPEIHPALRWAHSGTGDICAGSCG